MSIDVYNLQGESVGKVDLPAEWFEGKVNIPVMHQVVTAQLAAARQGTHKTKTRAEVAGGGSKPWRQKGTGRARHGSIRAPQWVGGGVAHGRVPKDWSVRVNKKVKRAALRSALTDRANHEAVTVVRDLAFEAPKTKDAAAALHALGHADKKVLVVLSDADQATIRSFRNLPTVHTLIVDQLNSHDVLTSDVVVFDEAALELIGSGRRKSTATVEEVDREVQRLCSLSQVLHGVIPVIAGGVLGSSGWMVTPAPEETEILSLTAEPYEDGRRVRVNIEMSPFEKRPHLEFVLTDSEDREISNASFVEPMAWKLEFTLHLRTKPADGPLELAARLYYPDGPEAEPVSVRFDLESPPRERPQT